jgi:putative tryptophan/tyrosine transport system substrate-binding protein
VTDDCRMKRRNFIAGAAAAALPFAAHAQQPSVPFIGFMSSRSSRESQPHTAAFLDGLRETGFVPGQSVQIEFRWVDGRYEALAEIATELVKLPLAVLVAPGGAASARAAKAATSKIPIVFLIGDDPVQQGLVASLNRPNTNATGVSFLTGELGSKRANLLCQLLPEIRAFALLVNPAAVQTQFHIEDVRRAAEALQRRLLVVSAGTEPELEAIFTTLSKEAVGGLVVQNDPFFDSQRDRIIALADRYTLPAIYHIREFPAAGGLMSYGTSLLESYKQVGVLTGRILKGERPQDMPVLRPSRFEFVVNSKTARRLGLSVPPQLLAITDDVIE